jgi:hypothetical protein
MNDVPATGGNTSIIAGGNLAETKQLLEIEKLRLETKYIPRNFLAQVLNTTALIFIALAVLYFFQRPQIEQTERHQVTSHFLTVHSKKDLAERAAQFDFLAEMYPQYQIIQRMANVTRALFEKPVIQPGAPKTQLCDSLKQRVNELDRLRHELVTQFDIERSGAGRTGIAGIGAIARAIQQQIRDVENELIGLAGQQRGAGC